MMEKWKWKGNGKIENGRMQYSSITSGQKVVSIGDTIFINSCAPELYVGKVKSFHENLTDGQSCADIVWYFRPGEMEQWLAKIPKVKRPHLPSLSDCEVVITNFQDTIEVSTIFGRVHIQEVSVSTSVHSVSAANNLFARFRFDITKKTVSHLVAPMFVSSVPNKLLSGGGGGCDNGKCDSLYSKSQGGRVRFRSKGELRPVVPCSRVSRKLPLTPPWRIASTSSKAVKKKQCSYLDFHPTQSQSLPRLITPSFVSDTLSHDPHAALPIKLSHVATDPLNSDPSTNKFSPVNRAGKMSPCFDRKMTYVSTVSGVCKRICGVVKGSPEVLMQSAACNKSPVGKGSSLARERSRSLLNNFEKTCQEEVNFEDVNEAKYRELGKTPETNEMLEPDLLIYPVKSSPQKKIHSRKRPHGNGNEVTPKSSRKMKIGQRKVMFKDSPFSEANYEEMLAMATPPSTKKVLFIPEKQEEAQQQRERRSRKRKAMENAMEKARERLHVSSVPETLACRDEEFSTICRFVEEKLEKKTGGSMYISGMPGVGKTATVKEVARYLQEAAKMEVLPPFKFVEVNGMKLSDPRRVYASIMLQLTGQKLSSEKAALFLKAYFSSPNLTVLLADELDLLWTRKQEVLYDIFGWPGQLNSRLILLAVANTMDLHDRVMKDSTSSRLGLTRVDFKPYTHQQLQEIVKLRMNGLSVFAPDAVELAARTIAVKCGDARRALDVCRRAVEIAEDFSSPCPKGVKSRRRRIGSLVGMGHIQKAIKEMCNLPMIMAIKHATLYQKMFLRAVVAIFRSTGIEETTFRDVYLQLKDLLEMEGLAPLTPPLVNDVCSSLCASGIILEGTEQCDITRTIRLFPQLYEVTAALDA